MNTKNELLSFDIENNQLWEDENIETLSEKLRLEYQKLKLILQRESLLDIKKLDLEFGELEKLSDNVYTERDYSYFLRQVKSFKINVGQRIKLHEELNKIFSRIKELQHSIVEGNIRIVKTNVKVVLE